MMILNDDVFDFMIEKLTKLLIEQEFKDKDNNRKTYVRKTDCYKNFIKFLKEMRVLFNER